MQIVIEIPEEEYEYLKTNHSHEVFYGDAIANGTPLPEHHGRLIDADELYMHKFVEGGRHLSDISQWIAYKIIEAAPTIIPATKEGEKLCQ